MLFRLRPLDERLQGVASHLDDRTMGLGLKPKFLQQRNPMTN